MLSVVKIILPMGEAATVKEGRGRGHGKNGSGRVHNDRGSGQEQAGQGRRTGNKTQFPNLF